MSALLITGINGFVGSNLTARLKDTYRIYGLDIIRSEADGVAATFTEKDIEQDCIPPVDAIIHLAGKVVDSGSNKDAAEYFKNNTELTKKIYDYFAAHSYIRKFIFFSSVKAVAGYLPEGALTEDAIPEPSGAYGLSKLLAEKYIADNSGSASGRQVIILRPCLIHGARNRGNIRTLYRYVKTGLPWPLGNFENKRSLTAIGNLEYIISGLLEKQVESGIYNVADDEAMSTNELIDAISAATGKKTRIVRVSKNLVRTAAKCGDALRLPLNTSSLNKLTQNFVVSNVKIKKALGITHMPVDARTGIETTVKSFDNGL